MSGKQDQSNPTYRKFGWARWIGPSWRGHTTTSGEIFQPERLTGSHATLPLPSFVYVTNRTNGRTVLIRVNDRVPHSDAQAIIVSQRAAELLDFVKAGRVMVDIQYAGPASPLPNAKHEEAFLRQQPWFKRDLVQDGRAVGAPIGPTDMSVGQRYPTPTYPRWDGTQRQR
jgi:rare lipoprotein A (peptidoglycan hydrolase)